MPRNVTHTHTYIYLCLFLYRCIYLPCYNIAWHCNAAFAMRNGSGFRVLMLDNNNNIAAAVAAAVRAARITTTTFAEKKVRPLSTISWNLNKYSMAYQPTYKAICEQCLFSTICAFSFIDWLFVSLSFFSHWFGWCNKQTNKKCDSLAKDTVKKSKEWKKRKILRQNKWKKMGAESRLLTLVQQILNRKINRLHECIYVSVCASDDGLKP